MSNRSELAQRLAARADRRREALETLATELPEVGQAMKTHKAKLQSRPRSHPYDGCAYCMDDYSRHRHTFADRELRVSNPDTDFARVYAKHSAVAAIAAMRMMENARESARHVRETEIPPLISEAREAYPQAELAGQWAVNVLAESDLPYAVKLADAESRCLPAYAIEPVTRAAFQLVREASDLDTMLVESGHHMPIADSPMKAAELYGLATAA